MTSSPTAAAPHPASVNWASAAARSPRRSSETAGGGQGAAARSRSSRRAGRAPWQAIGSPRRDDRRRSRTGPSRRTAGGRRRHPGGERGLEGAPDVVVVGGQFPHDVGPARAADVALDGLDPTGEPLAVAGGERVRLAGLAQFDGGQFADQLEHRPALGQRRDAARAARPVSAGGAPRGRGAVDSGARHHTPPRRRPSSRCRRRRRAGRRPAARRREEVEAPSEGGAKGLMADGSLRLPWDRSANRSAARQHAGSGRSTRAAAASSMASGIPSRWATIVATSAALSSVRPEARAGPSLLVPRRGARRRPRPPRRHRSSRSGSRVGRGLDAATPPRPRCRSGSRLVARMTHVRALA